VWGSEFTTKADTPQGNSAEIVPSPRFGSRGFPGGEARRAATSGCRVDHAGLEVHEHRAGHALACGRVWLRNTYFGHVLLKVRQGRQRRNAVTAGDEQHGRCIAGQSKYYQLYVNSGKLFLAAMYLRRVRVVGRSIAAAPTHVSTVVSRR
jgi:hypothetical protein